jgi:hypothetical protein
LSFDATDAAVLNAMHNLSMVEKVSMLGLRDYETSNKLNISSMEAIASAGNPTQFKISQDLTKKIAVGDVVTINGIAEGLTPRHVIAVSDYTTLTTVTLNEEVVGVVDSYNYSVNFGNRQVSKTALPGRVSVVATSNDTIYTSESWASFSLSNKKIWIANEELTVDTVSGNTVTLQANSEVSKAVEGAIAYRSAYGYDRAIILKSASSHVRSARVTVDNDWRGTDVKVAVHRSEGVAPGNLLIGSAAPVVQTITFRAHNASKSSDRLSEKFNLALDGLKTGDLEYGSSEAEWKSALELLSNVNRVSVVRTGDGKSAGFSYGYVYTVTFWAAYGQKGIQALTAPAASGSNIYDDDYIKVFYDTLETGEINAGSSARYNALDDASTYTVRARALNKKGISPPSAIMTKNTEHIGGLPSSPQSIVLGQYQDSTSLSLSYDEPLHDGGLPITSYVIELDSSSSFDMTSDIFISFSYSSIV